MRSSRSRAFADYLELDLAWLRRRCAELARAGCGGLVRPRSRPMFLAGFAEAEIVGTCEKLDDPNAPVWSKVHLENVEAIGCGTIASDAESGAISPHIHTSLGIKDHGATGHTSHLLSARVLFLVEMLIIEVAGPAMRRQRNPSLYDVPLLTFDG